MSSRSRKSATKRAKAKALGVPVTVAVQGPTLTDALTKLAPAIRHLLQRVGKVAGETRDPDTKFELEQAITKFHTEAEWGRYDSV